MLCTVFHIEKTGNWILLYRIMYLIIQILMVFEHGMFSLSVFEVLHL